MSDEKDIDDSDLQQDSPAEAISEVTDPDGQTTTTTSWPIGSSPSRLRVEPAAGVRPVRP